MLVPRSTFRAGAVGPQRVVGVQASQTGAGQLSQGFDAAADAVAIIEDDINTADAKQADTNFSNEVRQLLFEDGNGFINRLGRNAIDGRDGVNEALTEARERSLSGLSGGAREKAQAAIEARYQGATERIDRHTTAQRVGYLNSTSDARISSAVSDAVIDPSLISQSLKTITQETIDAGQRNGHSPEVIRANLNKAQTDVHVGVIRRIAAQNPIEALRYLQDNKKKINGREVASLTAALNPAAKKYEGRNLGKSAFNKAQLSLDTRAVNKPSDQVLNISLDFNAAENKSARGTEVIVPDNASPEVKAAASRFNDLVVAFAEKHGISHPNRGVKTRSQNGRGVSNTVHVEPFFRDNVKFQNLIEHNFSEFAGIYNEAFGGLEGTRIIPPHGVGRDRGATSEVFGNETAFGKKIIQNLINGRSSDKERANDAALDEVLSIEDPDKRDAALREFNLLSKVSQDRSKRDADKVADLAFKTIVNGGTVDDLPIEAKEQLGRQELSALYAFQDKVNSEEEIETDDETFVELSELASTNPQSFADINPIQYRNSLSDGDFRKFVERRGKILQGEDKVKSPTISSLRTSAKTALSAAGFNLKNDAEEIASFERQILDWGENFTNENNKVPTPQETQQKINELLTPVSIDPAGFLSRKLRKQQGKAFEIDFDGKPFDTDDDLTLDDIQSATIKINDVVAPTEVLQSYVSIFTEKYGRAPRANEVISGLIESGLFK